MSRAIFIIAALLLASVDLPARWQISGTVRGADGNPPVVAHVHLTGPELLPRTSLQTVSVDKEGRYRLIVEKGGYYLLWFTAAHHPGMAVPIYLSENQLQLGVDVTLAPFDYPETFSRIKIVGDWNNYRFSEAEPMTPQPDGTFTYTRTATADTLGYQLLGVIDPTRSINGTMSDYFRYDGGGDYRSILRVKPGQQVTIVFDPAKLFRGSGTTPPRVTFHPENPDLQLVNTFYQEAVGTLHRYIQAVTAYRQEHGTREGFAFDFGDFPERLRQTLSHESPLVRQYAAAYLAWLDGYREVQLDSTTITRIWEILTSTSPLWEHSPFQLGTIAHTPWAEKADSVFLVAAEQNPSRKVRAMALCLLLERAARAGDRERQKQWAERLRAGYMDEGIVRFFLSRYDPGRRINPGNPIPQFQVKLLDSGEVFSNQNLRGKFYLLDFWATWCTPCVEEMPNLHKAYAQFKDRNFQILSFSLDSKPEAVQEFRKTTEWKMPWLHAFLPKAFDNEVAKAFEVQGIPRPILVSPEGIILAIDSQLRGDNLFKTLKKFLAQTEVRN